MRKSVKNWNSCPPSVWKPLAPLSHIRVTFISDRSLVWPKIPQMPHAFSAQFVCISPKLLDFNEKRLHWASPCYLSCIFGFHNKILAKGTKHCSLIIEHWILDLLGALNQGPLKIRTEHSQELFLLNIHCRGAPITPWAGWGSIFCTMSFYSYQDLSNEGSKIFLRSVELDFWAAQT